MRMTKRGRPETAEGKREGYENQAHTSKEGYQKFKPCGPPNPCCGPKIKYISTTKNPPGWGEYHHNKTTPQHQSMIKIKRLQSTRSKPDK